MGAAQTIFNDLSLQQPTEKTEILCTICWLPPFSYLYPLSISFHPSFLMMSKRGKNANILCLKSCGDGGEEKD